MRYSPINNNPFNLGIFFKNIALQYPDNIALIYENNLSINYRQLDKLSDQIAYYFLEIGTQKNDVIAILNDKTVFGYATMIACLKIGATYLNVDFDQPSQRLHHILNQCNPRWIISDVLYDIQKNLDHKFQKIFIYFPEIKLKKKEVSLPLINVIGTDPAYLMFTSGSTGIPKGAIISHQSVINFINWIKNRFSITTNDRFTQLNPIYFDNSVFDFYGSLFTGASLVPIKKSLLHAPDKLVEFIDKNECSIWFSVPSLLIYLLNMKCLNKNNLNKIRSFIFGGEGFPKGKLQKLYNLYGQNSQLMNVYGPTEGTCICSSYEITDKDFSSLNGYAPLGFLNENFDFLLLDENQKLLKNQNEVGELALIGPQLALGYYRDPERTSERFIQNPANSAYPEIIYRTGDLVQISKEGFIFIGRADHQIKHMGYRIELEEIESAINQLPEIAQSAAVYVRLQEDYGKIALFIAAEKMLHEEKIRNSLKNYLPDYMIPNIITQLDALPKNANGKIDRKALAETALNELKRAH